MSHLFSGASPIRHRPAVLVWLPQDEEVQLAGRLLTVHGVELARCEAVEDLLAGIDTADGAILDAALLERAGREGGLDALGAWLARQPLWSDFPLLLVAGRHEAPPAELTERLGNLRLIERPLGKAALSVAVAGLLRDRQRQHLLAPRLVATADAAGQLQVQKMEAIGALAGGIAHDFNNLLTAITGGLDLIAARAALDGPTRRLLDNARLAADRGTKLTRRLLSFARKQPPLAEAVEIDAAIRGLHDMLTATMGGLIRIELKLDAEGGLASTDPIELEMALLNLAVNARDAMPLGGTLTVSTARHRQMPGVAVASYIEIAVADTGTGMSAEVLARVFDPFFTTKERGKGTGLGLAQIRDFAAQAGGGVFIESAPGAGTTVFLFLPEAPAAAVLAALPERSAATLVPRRVLLVEDDEAVRLASEAMLETLNCEVAALADATAALELLRRRPEIEVLIADIGMTGMNGLDLARSAIALAPDLAVIFTTGHLDLVKFSAEIGERPVLKKPYTRTDLAAALAGLNAERSR